MFSVAQAIEKDARSEAITNLGFLYDEAKIRRFIGAQFRKHLSLSATMHLHWRTQGVPAAASTTRLPSGEMYACTGNEDNKDGSDRTGNVAIYAINRLRTFSRHFPKGVEAG